MKRSPTKFVLLAGAVSLLAAIPAFGQEEKAPESLLPPGFGDPSSLPPPEKTPGSPPADPAAPAPPGQPGRPLPPEADPLVEDSAAEDLEDLPFAAVPGIEIPEASRRPNNFVGPLNQGNWVSTQAAFGKANGSF